jgi:ABC-type multidrug transport system fused ATPase/permease subunit
MILPSIADRPRRWLIGLLVILAITQAGTAAAGSAAMGATIAASADTLMGTAGLAAFFALLAGLAIIGERTVAERLAQSLVHDVRSTIFEAVINHGQGTTEERWLTPLVGDLAALRNWAARGVVRLWTSGIAALGGVIAFLLFWRDMGAALLPFLVAMVIMPVLLMKLRATIANQRVARGRLTRFLLRRVRAEVAGQVRRGRHGRKCLATRSLLLASWAQRRALWAAMLEGTMLAAGGLAALLLILTQRGTSAGQGDLIAALALIAFIGSRALEFGRALHANAAGQIALDRLRAALLRRQAAGLAPSLD